VPHGRHAMEVAVDDSNGLWLPQCDAVDVSLRNRW
jgi:hypothetical protein